MIRYEAWRNATEAPGPATDAVRDHLALNQTFFAQRASQLEFDLDHHRDSEPWQLLEDGLRADSTDASELLRELLADRPVAMRLQGSVTHDETTAMWQYLAGPIARTHHRPRHDWRFVNGMQQDDQGNWQPAAPYTSPLHTLAERYLMDMDEPLEAVASVDNPLAQAVRALYRNHPGYRGPEVWDDTNP